MAELVIKKWQCDRCGVILDKRPLHPGVKCEIRGSENYETAPGPRFEWKDICHPCNDKVKNAIRELMTDAQSDRRAVKP